MQNIIPQPASIKSAEGTFSLTPETVICVPFGEDEVHRAGQYLADILRPATGYRLPILATTGTVSSRSIFLAATHTDSALGEEGYELWVEAERVTLIAQHPAGLLRGIQTIRQLLPPAIEMQTSQPGPWTMEAGIIRDIPRYPWRGVMLDVARHFFPAETVKRFIDQIACYKLNVLHLHLTDDQGWRLMINSWPRLAKHGGKYSVNKDAGGYYTQDEYREIVEYAAERYITIVPEVDMPGHTHAALASYARLNDSGKTPELYTGTGVGFSSLAIHKDITYRFLEEVIQEIVNLTPGAYFHIGGDEAHSTPEADYIFFIKRVQQIVREHKKICVGWEEIAKGELLPDTLVQYWWNKEWAREAIRQGCKFIMSPASHAYMDIKYNAATPLGQDWTQRYIEIQDAYEWDPETILEGLEKDAILGVEAPLWSETTATTSDLEYMIFPRLPGYAEIGWSSVKNRNWADYRLRLAAHASRLAAMGVNFYRSPQVPWSLSENYMACHSERP